MIRWISKYIGWRHWAVLNYNAVFENFFVLLYIALVDSRYDASFIADSFILIIFSIFATTYGYLINDYSDIDLDRLHGKSNTFESDSKAKALVVIILITLLSIVSCYPFWRNSYFVLWAVSWFAIATFYSLKPVRLKERGTVGIVFVVMAQRVLPALIIFAVFGFTRRTDIALLLLYILFRGFSSDVNHQLSDYEKDRQTGTTTFAVAKGYRRVYRIFQLSLHAERILLSLILVRMSLILPLENWWLKGFYYLLVAIYFAALIVHYIKRINDPAERQRNPFAPQQRSLVQFLHHAFPSVGLPVGLNLILSVKYFPFLLLLLIQIMAKRLYSADIIKNNFLTQTLAKIWKTVR